MNAQKQTQTVMQKIKAKIKPKTLLIVAIPVFILLTVLIIDFLHPSSEFTVITESSLKETLLISKVETLEYTYNSTVAVPNKEKAKYYVAYEGTVKLGFNMENIQVTKDEQTYIVTLPEMEVANVNVDMTLDFIFTEDKYNTDTVYQEAFNAATEDLKKKANANSNLFELARESAISSVKSWLVPWEAQLEDGYSIVVQ